VVHGAAVLDVGLVGGSVGGSVGGTQGEGVPQGDAVLGGGKGGVGLKEYLKETQYYTECTEDDVWSTGQQ